MRKTKEWDKYTNMSCSKNTIYRYSMLETIGIFRQTLRCNLWSFTNFYGCMSEIK